MHTTIADQVVFIHKLERRLLSLAPETEGWLDAQDLVVRARANYWVAMGQKWDLNHPLDTQQLPD